MSKSLYNYQQHAYEHVMANPYCGLFMEMGLGKTIVSLLAINRLMYHDFSINKVLVIAPLNVAQTVWDTELKDSDWKDLNIDYMRVSKILGTQQQRRQALYTKADIYIINCENIPWLVSELQSNWFFDMVIVDESSKFKNNQAVRFKALKVVLPLIKRVVILTGTPSPNGLIDIWAQMYLVDRGKRLGKSISEFRVTYFSPAIQEGYVVYKYAIKKGMEKRIYGKIKDIVISMKQKDYLELPPLLHRQIEVSFSPEVMAKYNEFEDTQVLKLISENNLRLSESGEVVDEYGNNISAITAAALRNKLLQYSNGAVYDNELHKNWHWMHDAKLDALQELIEVSEGQNIIVFYNFKHDAERILKRFKYAVKLDRKKIVEQCKAWNEGKIKLLVGHPASAGHGLNLQLGGHIVVWFGLNDALELYDQANKRLHRPGQTKPVVIYKLVNTKTMDKAVIQGLAMKSKGQAALMNAVKVIIAKRLAA